ncbi:MAG: DnaB-like helicase C-terminal domain-containing protein [Candidatus Micrarchaeaceae archaeon]
MNFESSWEVIDQLIALAITDDLSASMIHEFYKDLYPLISSFVPRKIAVRSIYRYYSKFKKAPGFTYFGEEYRNEFRFALRKGYVDEQAKVVVDAYEKKIAESDSVFRNSINKDYVISKFGVYLEKEVISESLTEIMAKLRGEDDPEEVLSEVKTQLGKISGIHVGYDHCSVVNDPDHYLSMSEDTTSWKSGVGALDELDVCPKPGTLYLLAAVPNMGKSWFLTNIVSQNLLDFDRKPKVAFLSLEMTPSRTLERIAMSLVRRPLDKENPVFPDFSNILVYRDPSSFLATVENATSLVDVPYKDDRGRVPTPLRKNKIFDVNLWWKELEEMGLSKDEFVSRFALFSSSPDSLTIRDFEGILDRYTNKTGFSPDILVIDYADLLRSHAVSKEYRHQISKIYEGLRSLALDRHLAVVTVSQIRRAGMERSKRSLDVSATELSEDFIGKFAIPDIVLTLYASDAQEALGQATISVEKTRETDAKNTKIYIQKGFQIGVFALHSWIVKEHDVYATVMKNLSDLRKSYSTPFPMPPSFEDIPF